MAMFLRRVLGFLGKESRQCGPANGMNYTHTELEADPVLKARIIAERRAVWDAGVFKPKTQCTDSSGRSEHSPAAPMSGK